MSNLLAVLSEVCQGKVKREAEDALQVLVQNIEKHGGAGHVTLKITVRRANEGSVLVTGEVTTKLPKPTLLPSVFFATEDFALVRHDPRQNELPMRIVEGAKPEPVQQKEASA